MSQRVASFSLHHTLLCFTYVSEPWRSKPLCFTRFLQWFWSLFLGWSRFLDFIDFVWFLDHFSSKSLCFAMIFNDFCYVSMFHFKINECYSVLLDFRCSIHCCVLHMFLSLGAQNHCVLQGFCNAYDPFSYAVLCFLISLISYGFWSISALNHCVLQWFSMIFDTFLCWIAKSMNVTAFCFIFDVS